MRISKSKTVLHFQGGAPKNRRQFYTLMVQHHQSVELSSWEHHPENVELFYFLEILLNTGEKKEKKKKEKEKGNKEEDEKEEEEEAEEEQER